MTKFMVGLIAVALFLPATASAEPFTPELEADYSAALAWWGVMSPPQCASVTRDILPEDVGEEDGIEAAARATQPGPGESGVACVLYVYADAIQLNCPERMILRHEVGHLLGYGHSQEPTNIMNPTTDLEFWCPNILGYGSRLHRLAERCREIGEHAKRERLARCWKNAREMHWALAD